MRLSRADVVVTSCVVHKFTSKVMVTPAIQKIADLRGKVLAVADPDSASDFTAKLFLARQGMRLGQDISIIYSGSTIAAFAALASGRVQGIFAAPPEDIQALAAGFRPLLELGDLNISYAGNCTAVMRFYLTKRLARVRAYVAGITEAIASISRRPNEARQFCKSAPGSRIQRSYDTPMIQTRATWSWCRIQILKGSEPSWNSWAYRDGRSNRFNRTEFLRVKVFPLRVAEKKSKSGVSFVHSKISATHATNALV